MRWQIISIGKPALSWAKIAVEDYLGRIQRMAQVEMVVSDPVRLVAVVTRDAVEELGLKNGMATTAIVKSTNVIIQS